MDHHHNHHGKLCRHGPRRQAFKQRQVDHVYQAGRMVQVFFSIWSKQTPLAGRDGDCIHGGVHHGDVDQDPGPGLHAAQGQLHEKPLELHGLLCCHIWVSSNRLKKEKDHKMKIRSSWEEWAWEEVEFHNSTYGFTNRAPVDYPAWKSNLNCIRSLQSAELSPSKENCVWCTILSPIFLRRQTNLVSMMAIQSPKPELWWPFRVLASRVEKTLTE